MNQLSRISYQLLHKQTSWKRSGLKQLLSSILLATLQRGLCVAFVAFPRSMSLWLGGLAEASESTFKMAHSHGHHIDGACRLGAQLDCELENTVPLCVSLCGLWEHPCLVAAGFQEHVAQEKQVEVAQPSRILPPKSHSITCTIAMAQMDSQKGT